MKTKEAIAKVIDGMDLMRDEAKGVFDEIMDGAAAPELIASFLTVLRMKGETVDEITGAALSMRSHAVKINVDKKNLLDTCGTGGDGKHTFNISTIAAFVASGAGAKVAKHGNKAVSSKCGSADLLSQLGVNIEAEVSIVERCIAEVGIGFLFAPLFHGAMRYALPVRRALGIRTIFNVLGPLTNPAGAAHQLLGVYSEALTDKLAEVLKNLGSSHALIVHGKDGLDEVTTADETIVSELKGGAIKSYEISPSQFGLKMQKGSQLEGMDASYNAKLALAILNNESIPQRDVVILNAGCAIYAADLSRDIKEGMKLAEESLSSKRAFEKLNLLIKYTNAR